MKEGDPVVYVDEVGVEHHALVTAVWTGMGLPKPDHQPGCNLVFVSSDPAKGDTYGRQIERRTSVSHQEAQMAPGNYWK